ncbi:type II restriction endonuclease subunit M [Azospirillum brasilense]|nr:type II restriction endonuclease subunit M [Azospirillum brasilense]
MERPASGWLPFAKGGSFSPFYSDVHLLVKWIEEGKEIEADAIKKFPYLNGNAEWVMHRECAYLRAGLTWPIKNRFSFKPRCLPKGCIFAHVGPSAFVDDDDPERLLAIQSIMSSTPFTTFVRLMAGWNFEVGVVQRTPFLEPTGDCKNLLVSLARRAWSLKRTLDTVEEISHAFLLPAALRARLSDYNPPAIEAELARIQAEIDTIAFDLYGFGEADRVAALAGDGNAAEDDDGNDDEEDATAAPVETAAGLLSWAVGVAFGRFDIRLATGERQAPPEPEPFDPLPARSPGMLPDGDAPFYAHAGILVDDLGNRHDLPDLIDRVLDHIGMEIAIDTRGWLRREFFPMHLKQYSKSRRKAPIYWPLSTVSGGYTLWLYYPALTDQTLYSAANDFVGTKLDREVEPALRSLRYKTGRSSEEERTLEELQILHDELQSLRDELLRLAPLWKPNHDDGVQITAAPLWRLFRHRSWQTVLRDTWEKLEAGEYDWAHLAMTCWPERVREKCRTDRSLAIAHDLEDLYEPPPEAPAKAKGGRGRKKKG